jgi:4-diphosphocytidyl-2-C-methyl-D-erythritol kinase
VNSPDGTFRTARVAAQGKLNLRLRILAREASGYHQLETVFARIALADDLVVRVGGRDRSLDGSGAALGPSDRNLAWRAALAFAERCGWPQGFAITLEKRIAVGGGLGGGSADAGAVLRALNALAPAPLREHELLQLAIALGADVPYLTTTFPIALAWGRGERMLPLPQLPERGVVLFTPPFGVTTAAAFGWLAESRTSSGGTPEAAVMLNPGEPCDWNVLARLYENDFEHVVSRHFPELGTALRQLRDAAGIDALVCGMTGSGSTLFMITSNPGVVEFAVPAGWTVTHTTVCAPVAGVELLP